MGQNINNHLFCLQICNLFKVWDGQFIFALYDIIWNNLIGDSQLSRWRISMAGKLMTAVGWDLSWGYKSWAFVLTIYSSQIMVVMVFGGMVFVFLCVFLFAEVTTAFIKMKSEGSQVLGSWVDVGTRERQWKRQDFSSTKIARSVSKNPAGE